MTELKPCPFCGNKASIERMGNNKVSMIYSCNYCCASLETGEGWLDDDCDWNTRHNEKAPKLDVPYFEKNLKVILRDIKNYTSDEMGRALQRLADVANQ